MSFIVRLLRFLFWVALLSWGVSLLRRLVERMGAGPERERANRDIDVSEDAVSQKLVRDPVCGMHLAPGLALATKQGGETLYFCSEQCRDQYMNQRGKFAANA